MIIDDDGTMHGTEEEFAALKQEYIDKIYGESMVCKTDPCVSPRHRYPGVHDGWGIFERAVREENNGRIPAELIIDLMTDLLLVAYDLGEKTLWPGGHPMYDRPQLTDDDPIRTGTIAADLLNAVHAFYLSELKESAEQVAAEAEWEAEQAAEAGR